MHEKKPWRIVGSSALRLQLKSQNRTKAIGRSETQTIYKLQPFKVPSEWVGDSHLACTVWSFESGLAIKLESTSGNISVCLAWVGVPHIHTVVGAAHSKGTSVLLEATDILETARKKKRGEKKMVGSTNFFFFFFFFIPHFPDSWFSHPKIATLSCPQFNHSMAGSIQRFTN